MNSVNVITIIIFIQCLWTLYAQESNPCDRGYRRCPISKKCVGSWQWCDGYNNCGYGDGADEKDCENLVHYPCKLGIWKCNITNRCLLPFKWCNGKKDCGPDDDSDEASDCAGTCPPGFRRCAKSQSCLRSDWWCDGIDQCGFDDDTDEQSGCVPSLCPPGYRRCSIDKRCILSKFWCDGNVDCGFDGSDETSDCETGPCREGYRKCSISKRCVPLELWCNGVKDCGPDDNSDEKSDCDDFPCRPGYRRCAVSKHCVPSDWWCDGNLDCGYGDTTDEPNDCACPELHFKNGSLSSECLRHRHESCEIVCNSGYLPKKGSSPITCGPFYQWSGNLDDDACEAILCPEVEIKNGSLLPKCVMLANHTCEFKCDARFTPKGGSSEVTCGPMGKWMEDIEDVCEAIICPEIEMKNGTLSQTCQRFPNETCKFKCDAGFTPKDGLTNVTCGPLGKWTEDMDDICEEIDDGKQTITLVAIIVVFLLLVAIVL